MGHAAIRSPIYPLVHKSLDEKARTVESVLTWHVKDLEGEIIRPEGVRVKAEPFSYPVDWTHGVYVGKGFASHKSVRDAAAGADVWRIAPVGRTHFFQTEADVTFDTGRYSRSECVDAGCQSWELYKAGLADGVSIEVEPISKVLLGKSLAKGGQPAYRYDDSILRGWAHTLNGGQVQPWAQTILEKALEVGRSGKLPSGAAMLPTIRKAFDSLLAAHPRPASVTVPRTVEKGMPPDMEPDTAPPMDDAATAPPVEEPEAGPTGTATSKAAYTLTQAISDAVAAVREMLKDGEHPKGKAKLGKLLESLEADAEEASAIGDMVASDVGGPDGDPETPDEEEAKDADSPDSDVEESDDEKTEKALKIVPVKKSLDGGIITATGYAPRRFSFRDVKDVTKAAATQEITDPETTSELAREFQRLTRSTTRRTRTR